MNSLFSLRARERHSRRIGGSLHRFDDSTKDPGQNGCRASDPMIMRIPTDTAMYTYMDLTWHCEPILYDDEYPAEKFH